MQIGNNGGHIYRQDSINPFVPPSLSTPDSKDPTPAGSAGPAEWAILENRIRERGGALVAFSGGVDSTLVAAAAVRAVGPHQGTPGIGTLGVLADSTTLARRELHLARATADQIGMPLLELEYSELENPDWVANQADRCYHCKNDLAQRVLQIAPVYGYTCEQVAYGTTTSDLGDHRPGLQAIGETRGWQPLVDAGFSKDDVRTFARRLGLPVWDKPATPCLASRVQYGEKISEKTLQQIERAEDALRVMGFDVLRVRHHDRLARIEVPPERLHDALEQKDAIIAAIQAAGYVFVTLDLQGHRSGAMNEALEMH